MLEKPLGSSGFGSLDPLSQQLLDAAQQHGGALAQSAAEVVHPNSGFLSMAQDAMGSAFHGIMDTLALPQEAITALLSQGIGTPMNFNQVREKHMTPSSLMLGTNPLFGTGTAQKVGDFGVRFLADVLADPLTYVTFGEGSGVKSLFGLSKLTKIPIKPATASELGFSEKELVDVMGSKETIKHMALSNEGVAARDKIVTRMEEQIKKDTLEQWNTTGFFPEMNMANSGSQLALGTDMMAGSASNLQGRLSRSMAGLIGASEGTFNDFLKTNLGAENIAAREMRDTLKASGHLGKAPVTPSELDAWRGAQTVATKNALDAQAERLIRHTLDAKRGDIEREASEALSHLIERNAERGGVVLDKLGNPVADQFGNQMVKSLAHAYIDKGGVKFFGQALISGTKIRTALKLLGPGKDLLEAKFGPKVAAQMEEFTRTMNTVRSGFSAKYNEAGRIPDTMLQMMEKAKNTSSARVAAVATSVDKLFDKLGVTKDDDKALSWMLAADKPPATGDGRYEMIYNLLNSPNGQQTALDIAGGKYGDDTKRIWQAAQAVRDINKRNLLAMRESGMAVFKQDNHISNMLNEPKGAIAPYRTLKSAKSYNAQKSEISKFRNIKNPEDIKYGNENALNLKKVSIAEEKSRLNSKLDEEVLRNTEKTTEIKTQVSELWDAISKKMKDTIVGPMKLSLKAIAGDDKHNYKALVSAVRDAIPEVDRNVVLEEYGKRAAAASEGIFKKMGPEDIIKLKTDLATGDKELDTVALKMMQNASDFIVPVAKKPVVKGAKAAEGAAEEYQKVLEAAKKTVMEHGMEAKKRMLADVMERPLDQSGGTIKDILIGLSDEWSKSPDGVERMLGSIGTKTDKLSELMSSMDETRKALEQELASPGLKMIDGDFFYKNASGDIYERERASAASINQILYKGDPVYVESASKQLLNSALNVARTTASKDFLDDTARHFGVKKFAAPSNYVRIGLEDLTHAPKDLADSIAQRAKKDFTSYEGEDLFYHPTVALAIQDMIKVMDKDPASNFWAQGYDKLTNIWKASVTSIFPMFHGRNAISNVFQNFMNLGYEAANPHTHMLSARMILHNRELEKLGESALSGTDPEAFKKLTELYDKPVMTDRRGYTWTVGELNSQLRDNVIAFNPSILGSMDTQRTPKAMLTEVQDHLYPETNKYLMPVRKTWQKTNPFELGRSAGNMVESQARMVNFLSNLKETGNVEHSTQMVKQYLFDYQNLTPFERGFMRRVIPFYTYTRKNMELMTNTLVHNPGRIEAFNTGFQTLGNVFSGGQLSDEERSALPKWMRDGVDIVLARKGSKVGLLTSLQTPVEQPTQALANLFGSMNPILKIPIEQTAGYSFFYGKPLSDVTNADMYASPLVPKALKDAIGFETVTYTTKDGQTHTKNVALDPRTMNLISNLPLAPRLLSSLKTWDDSPPTDLSGVFQNLFGVKITNEDLELERNQRMKETQQQLEKLLSDAGVGYSFTRFQLKK